jgi:tetratricopeptide (TPR) repeat protein
VNRAFALDTIDASLAKAGVSPSILTNCVETPAGWLEQAQHAAKDANSPDELSSIVEFCDRGLRSIPDEKQSSSLRRLSAWAHNRRGELLADADRNDDALSDFQAAISLDQACSLAIHNRAVTFAQQNQFDAALRDFNRVIELNPGLAVAYRNRAELLAALGRMEEAVSDYNQAVESLPNDAQIYRDRAYAYQQLGELSKSAADITRALEIAPDNPDALTQRGNLAAEQGDYDQAVVDFQQALTKDPNWAEAHRGLAWLAATCPNKNFQNPHEAIAAAERAAKLASPNDYLILDTLAAAHASAGHFDQACDFQQQALACAPPKIASSLKQRLALYRKGHAFRKVGAPDGEHDTSSDDSVESNLPVGALR